MTFSRRDTESVENKGSITLVLMLGKVPVMNVPHFQAHCTKKRSPAKTTPTTTKKKVNTTLVRLTYEQFFGFCFIT